MESNKQLPFPELKKSNSNEPTLTNEESDLINEFNFLPHLYNLINALEHCEDSTYSSQLKELSEKMQQKIQQNVELIENLSGTELSNQEQLNQLNTKFNQLKKKRDQRAHYLTLPIFNNNELLNKINTEQ